MSIFATIIKNLKKKDAKRNPFPFIGKYYLLKSVKVILLSASPTQTRSPIDILHIFIR